MEPTLTTSRRPLAKTRPSSGESNRFCTTSSMVPTTGCRETPTKRQEPPEGGPLRGLNALALLLLLPQRAQPVLDDARLTGAEALADQTELDLEEPAEPPQVGRDLAAHDVPAESNRVELAAAVHVHPPEESFVLAPRPGEGALEEGGGLLAQLVGDEV